jgi:hypothetical protein
VVVHIYNPSYLEGRGRRIAVQGQPRKKQMTQYEKQTKVKKAGGMAQEVRVLA